MTTKPATIPASQILSLKSKWTGRKYQISIAIPYAYFSEQNPSWPFDKPLKKWPVVYLMGANYHFGLVTDMVRSMAWCGRPTDAIIVGVGYPVSPVPQEAWRDVEALRERDFTPVRDEKRESELSEFLNRKVETGGAFEFLQFIKQELIPMIETKFNADSRRRILAGHSAGGLFTASALFTEPGLFSGYAIGSPWLWHGDKVIFQQEEQFAKRHKRLAAKVYLWAGESEETDHDPLVSDLTRLESILQDRNYKGLTLIRKIFADENHCEVVAPGFHVSLKWLLEV
jgi:predicted alpha/beta superfamily hydrolase